MNGVTESRRTHPDGVGDAETAIAGRTERTRLAPSPTGALHLGNARTFLVNWALARRRGWRIVLRIEDLDTPRTKPNAAAEAIDTLRWLGMDWDEGPFTQTDDLSRYEAALRELASLARAYPCALTRTEIEAAASAPQEGADGVGGPGHEQRCPIELRPPLRPLRVDDVGTNWRFATPDEDVAFLDDFAGARRINPARTVGDFVIWTKRAQPAYQLAVVVDDHRQGVTRVVRGDDLLDSAARQLLLYRALGYAPEPSYTHLPLVRGGDGRRLAKRHGDTRVAHYRGLGAAPERVIGLIAHWCGATARREAMSAGEFLAAFDPDRMSHEPIVMLPEDDAWLRGG